MSEETWAPAPRARSNWGAPEVPAWSPQEDGAGAPGWGIYDGKETSTLEDRSLEDSSSEEDLESLFGDSPVSSNWDMPAQASTVFGEVDPADTVDELDDLFGDEDEAAAPVPDSFAVSDSFVPAFEDFTKGSPAEENAVDELDDLFGDEEEPESTPDVINHSTPELHAAPSSNEEPEQDEADLQKDEAELDSNKLDSNSAQAESIWEKVPPAPSLSMLVGSSRSQPLPNIIANKRKKKDLEESGTKKSELEQKTANDVEEGDQETSAGVAEDKKAENKETTKRDVAPGDAVSQDAVLSKGAVSENTEEISEDLFESSDGENPAEEVDESSNSKEVATPVRTLQKNPEEAPKRRINLAQRRAEAEAASIGLMDYEAARTIQEIAQQSAVPEHLWVFVDRLLAYVAASPAIQNVVNPFVLTRDKQLDSEQRRTLQNVIAPHLIDANVSIQPMEAEKVFDLTYDELIGISVLGPLWRDDSITEILVDGWNSITVERSGKLIRTPLKFRDTTHANRVARDLAATVSDRALTPTNPLVTAQLPGARVTFAYGAVVKSGLSISLRKFVDLLGIEKLLEFGALNQTMVNFLKECVEARATILVSGGTGTGKTTQINALSQFIPDAERVITIEDAFELQLSNLNWVALQTKEKSSADDTVVINQVELLVNTLRMRPDRVIVGEIREGQGAQVMLQAAITGHDGTMTTIHAQNVSVALNERLSDLVMGVTGAPSDVVRRSVASAIDLVVQVTRKQGRRFISEIAVVDRTCVKDGIINAEPIFIGDLSREGEVVFRHVGSIRPDTDLGAKMEEAGFDVEVWNPAS